MTNPLNKKRKAATASPPSSDVAAVAFHKSNAGGSSKAAARAFDREQLHLDLNYTALSLQDIHDRIRDLCYRVPVVPESGFQLNDEEGGEPEQQQQQDGQVNAETKNGGGSATAGRGSPSLRQQQQLDKTAIKQWADSMQCVLEEFNLLIGCISPATYVWGTDRSGAADQNLGLLSSELVRAQDQIATLVAPRLNDVLYPASSLVTRRTVTSKDETGQEVKLNYFETTLEDPDYVQLCHGVLARNAVLLRQVVLANLDKLLQAVKDYLAAQHKDSQHDSRGFVY